MAQKLILPIDDCQISAGYRTAKYLQEWGFHHYGTDLIERSKQRNLHACGNGTVVSCGMDGETAGLRLGNCIVIVYSDVQLPDGRVMSLSSRMFHLDRIDCKAGDKVNASTLLGVYGSTGQYSSGAHLHIEFDTDVQYPAYAYGISRSGNIIKKGSVDSTIDPCKVLWLGAGQSLTVPAQWIAEGWVDAASAKLPATGSVDSSGQLDSLKEENVKLKNLVARLHEMTA